MTDIKLVLADVDGTLAQTFQHTVSDKVRNAVIAVENAGVQVVPVTGRPFEMGLEIFNLLGLDGLCIVDNGATIRKITTSEVVWSRWFTVEELKQLAKILLPFAHIIDYAVEHDEHVPDGDELTLITESAPDIYASVHLDDVARVSELLDAVGGLNHYPAIRPGEPHVRGIQVTRADANKFHAIEGLRGILAVPKEQTLGIGDGDNDIPLFQNAGLKIAMGNASENLKAQADHIVGTVDEDGFVDAMHRFVLQAPASQLVE